MMIKNMFKIDIRDNADGYVDMKYDWMKSTWALSLTGIGPYLDRSSSTCSRHHHPICHNFCGYLSQWFWQISPHLLGLHLLLLLLQGGHLLGLTQGVDGDGKEDVEEGVVPKQGEEDEVGAVDLFLNDDKLKMELNGRHHSAGRVPPLRLYTKVHHLVPVFPGQDL